MRALIVSLVASGLVASAVACSSADVGKEPDVCAKGDDCDDTPAKKRTPTAQPEGDTNTNNTTRQEVPDATVPLPPATDAGTDSSTNTTTTPKTTYCRDLNPCCLTLASTVEKFACVGVSLAGKETACQLELALCSGGGVGGTPCSNLNKCCDQMASEGYGGDAADCRTHSAQNNATTCSSWLSTYKNDGWCD
jgi:hypothetical protein